MEHGFFVLSYREEVTNSPWSVTFSKIPPLSIVMCKKDIWHMRQSCLLFVDKVIPNTCTQEKK